MKQLLFLSILFLFSSNYTQAQKRIKYYTAKIELQSGKKLQGVLYDAGEKGILIIPKFSKKAFKRMEEQEQLFVKGTDIKKLSLKKKGGVGVSKLLAGTVGFATYGLAAAAIAAPFEAVGATTEETGEFIAESAITGAVHGATNEKNPQKTKGIRVFDIKADPKVYGFVWRQIHPYCIGIYEAN